MKIGIPLVFSGTAPQVRCLAEVLKNLGLHVFTSKTTTPELWEKALFLGSNETCLPVRIYIAHCHRLVEDLKVDVLIAPNLWREVEGTAACSKYRDVGGIALRALSSVADYALGKFPYLIQPDILSPKKEDLLPVVYEVINELRSAAARLGEPFPKISKDQINKAFAKVPDFAQECEVELEDKPRIGIIGRRYILEDPLLSLNIIRFFKKKGFQVVTPYDLPDRYFTKEGLPFGSYYDTHIQGEALLNWGRDKLHGVVILSNVACHLDAFQGEYFAQKAAELGLLAWRFVCDATVDLGGFTTRFETIAVLIEQNMQKTAARKGQLAVANTGHGAPVSYSAAVPSQSHVSPWQQSRETLLPTKSQSPRLEIVQKPKLKPKTIVTWPYMGEPLNLALKQLVFDLGAGEFAVPPKAVSEETLKRGSEDLAETCCPYALISGSLEETILGVYEEAGRPIDAKILMLHGEGPCAFGWYSIAMKEKLPKRLKQVSPEISLEWFTTGIDQSVSFWQSLASFCDEKFERLLSSFKNPLSFLQPKNLGDVLPVVRNALTKLTLTEKMRGLYLMARPFGGPAAEAAYITSLNSLDEAKNTRDMQKSYRDAREIFAAIIKDRTAPQVVIVGEIYVAITPYANRYAVDRLLGDAGLQVIEGITVSHYLKCSLRPAAKRLMQNLSLVKYANKKGLKLFAQGLRDKDSAPYMNFEVGGDGVLSVASARRALHSGKDGIVQIYPLNCMPEVVAKPAISELAAIYDRPFLSLSFNRETDTERLMTEVLTFARLIKNARKTSS